MRDIFDTIICADVLEGLRLIPDNSVSLVLTSPPYNVGIEYDNHKDHMPHDKYIDWLKSIFKECYRVLRSGGRLVINHDSTVNHQDDLCYFRPMYSELCNINHDIGFKFFTDIAWYKHQVVGRATAWGCYDDQTRVLTKEGFKYFKDIDINKDEFATLNIENKNVEYHKATNSFAKKYNGKMFKLKSNDFDLLVTPNHNMVIYNKYTQKNEFRQISECPKSIMIPQSHFGFKSGKDVKYFILPCCEYGKRTNPIYISGDIKIDMDDWLSFLGIFFTDGNVDYSEKRGCYKISIYQSKKKNIDIIQNLLNKLPFKFTRKNSKHEWYTCDKQLASWLKNFGNKNKRSLPAFILDLSSRQKKIFLDWLMIGDGHIGKCSYLAVASKCFVDSLSRILVDIGLTFSISVKKPQKNRIYKGKIIKSNYPLFIISFKKSAFYHLRQSHGNISQKQYNKYVYCVEVPNNTLFVERNGKTTWCGNSYLSCSTPIVRRNHEYMIVWSKDTFKLEGDSEQSDMTPDEFEQWTMSFWYIQPETRKMGGHPVPFPEELAKRVIKLFSYRGDVILDPFVGSGTTAYVAKRFNRKYIGIDNSDKYVKFARERISEAVDIFPEEYIPRSERIANRKIEKENVLQKEEPDILALS